MLVLYCLFIKASLFIHANKLQNIWRIFLIVFNNNLSAGRTRHIQAGYNEPSDLIWRMYSNKN